MRDYKVVLPLKPGPNRAIRNDMPPPKAGASGKVVDPVVQKTPGKTAPDPLSQFEALGDDDVAAVLGGTRYVPPDVNGDVSTDQFVEYINTIWAVYDKSGTLLLGPLPGNSFWAGLGGDCEANDDGDPVIKYDRAANRWFATQFSVSGANSHQCFAVSQTSDATGLWNQYDFFISNDFADYPKFGIWPDAYYMTANLFGTGFNGGAYAFNRDKMIANDPSAEMVSFFTTYNGGAEGGVLPSDWNGPQSPPPAGAPNYFMTFDLVPTPDPCAGSCLLIWQFHVDFETPGNSTFTGPAVLPVPAMNVPVCGSFRDQCVPQLGGELLETLSQDLMYPLPYRNLGDHEAIVAAQTVGNGSGVAQVRWYEINDPGGSPVLAQGATYAPDSTHRWMPSIAMDQVGNIALNYSRSDSSIHPQASITGRLAGDPPNTMGAEVDWVSGGGSQVSSFNRWGDYTSIFLDPVDDCTFWAMNEYYATTTNFDWKTRVGSFKFASCTTGPTGTLEGTVTRDDGVTPIQGATVTANTFSTTTNAAGHYSFLLPVGDYDMTATKFGYSTATAAAVPVTDGGDTVQNFQLTQTQVFLVTGVVKDGSGEGWPLYAKVDITAAGFPGATVYTDPVTGYYSTSLVGGIYTFTVTGITPGYSPGGGTVGIGTVKSDPGGQVVNWSLLAASPECIAPGYGPPSGGLEPVETFDSGTLPAGWSLVTNVGNPWEFDSSLPCNSSVGNLTGGSGGFAVGDGICDFLNFGVFDDNELITPSFDMSALTNPIIHWNNDFNQGPYYHQTADVDVSTDGGASWTNVWERTTDARGPQVQSVGIAGVAAGQADVKARFHYKADPNDFWAWWWQIDNVFIGQAPPCVPKAGGLVTGFVKDANTGLGLNGATVTNLPADGTTQTSASNAGDGYYLLFAGSGSQPFEASKSKYGTVDKSIVVVPNSTVQLDFSLPSGIVTVDPTTLTSKVNPPSGTDTQTLTLSNAGGADVTFKIVEHDTPLALPIHGKATGRIQWLQRPGAGVTMTNNTGWPRLAHPSAAVWHPDKPAASQPAILIYADDAVHTSPNTFLDQALQSLGLTYTAFYDGNFAGFETALSAGGWDIVLYGNENFNPPSSTLAALNTFATGGGKIIVDCWAFSRNLGSPLWATLGVSFASDNSGNPNPVYWWDPANQVFNFPDSVPEFTQLNGGIYGIYGQAVDPLDGFSALAGYTTPGPDPGQAALVIGSNNLTVFRGFADAQNSADLNSDGIPDGAELWTNLINGIETGFASDIPWVSEDPTEGVVPAASISGNTTVAVTFDATGIFPGLRQAQLGINTDTPLPVSPVGLNFTVRFLDVLDNDPVGTDPYENYIYGAAGANIMHGCDFYYFCPKAFVTRADMAGYIERSVHGAFAPPPAYTGIFSDVFFGDYNADYIQGLWNDQITGGCQFPGNPLKFCPNDLITRGQMAVFIERGKNGSDYVPPDCKGYFTDVTCPPTLVNPFGNWIEQLHNDGITAGCNLPGQPGYPKYCPDDPVPNQQMAVFIVKRWGFPVLP